MQLPNSATFTASLSAGLSGVQTGPGDTAFTKSRALPDWSPANGRKVKSRPRLANTDRWFSSSSTDGSRRSWTSSPSSVRRRWCVGIITALIHTGKHPAQKLLKARILLKADASDAGEGWSDSQIAAALESSVDTVARTRQRLVEEGLEAALTRKHSPNSARTSTFYGRAVDHVACSSTNILKPHLKEQWVIPPDANAAFVAAMEDILDVYQRPHDPECPMVCVDETSKQLIAETRVPIAAKPRPLDTITNTGATARPTCS